MRLLLLVNFLRSFQFIFHPNQIKKKIFWFLLQFIHDLNCYLIHFYIISNCFNIYHLNPNFLTFQSIIFKNIQIFKILMSVNIIYFLKIMCSPFLFFFNSCLLLFYLDSRHFFIMYYNFSPSNFQAIFYIIIIYHRLIYPNLLLNLALILNLISNFLCISSIFFNIFLNLIPHYFAGVEFLEFRNLLNKLGDLFLQQFVKLNFSIRFLYLIISPHLLNSKIS